MLLGLGIVSAEHRHYSARYTAWNYVYIRLFTIREIIDGLRAGFVIEEQELLPLPIFFYPLPVRALTLFL